MTIIDLNNKICSLEKNISEKQLSDIFDENWDIIFPNLIKLGKEFKLTGEVRSSGISGRIDFFAFNIETKKFVIIELKNRYDKNIRSQIFDYLDFVEENFDYILLRVNEKLKAYKKINIEIELIIISKNFMQADYNRLKRLNNSLTLIRYFMFENNQLLLDFYSKEINTLTTNNSNMDLKYSSTKEQEFDIWIFINYLIVENILKYNNDYKIVSNNILAIRINLLFKAYNKIRLNEKLPYFTFTGFKNKLKDCEEFLTTLNTRFGKEIVQAYRFDLDKLKNNSKLNKNLNINV